MTASAVRLTDVHKSFGPVQAVRGVSLNIPAGGVHGLLGPNGAGKTTTIRMILDILRPDRGERKVLGTADIGAIRNRLGYLPEERGLYRGLTPIQTLTYFGRLKGMSAAAARKTAEQLFETYGITDLARRRVKTLSKGQAQKVQILGAIIHDPELVILDEPFSGLDPVNQQVIEKLITDLMDRGKTVIFSTHVMEHAERLCDSLSLIANGRQVFSGTVAEAKALLPRQIEIDSPGDLRPLESVNGMKLSAAPKGESTVWRFEADRALDMTALFRWFSERNASITAFHTLEPNLRDVFVHIVGMAELEDAA